MSGTDFVVDTKQFLLQVKRYEDRAFAAKVRAMRDNGNDLQKESGKLAPIDEGTLLGSGTVKTNADMDRDEIETTVGYSTPYAAKVHNDMAPAPGATQRRGPGTLKKKPTEFGEAGGLYLQRPLLGKSQRYTQHIANRLKKVK